MKDISLAPVRRAGQKIIDAVAVAVNTGIASYQTPAAQLSKGEQRFFLGLTLSAGLANQAMAQATGSTTSTETAITSLKNLVFLVAQGIFAVFLVVALVKVAKKFMGGEPDAMTSLMWLIGGVLIFFGFSALKKSVVGGGEAGGGNTAGLLGQ